ncbi:3-hydroxyacyl-ACP dehydratase FabZ family protein [Leeia sp.]|uniref:3-hydroxyacyl-ACP dehydratase FabZ family protein n=1 Tax=Leeia sp. TaxID=2884678 RepID=UPI0035B0DE55
MSAWMPDVTVMTATAEHVALQFQVSPTLRYFEGHFPGMPILPGVVQLDWAVRLARLHLGLPLIAMSGMKALKFTAPVLPGDELRLLLSWQATQARLDFKYLALDSDKIFSMGQLQFAPAEA